MQDIPRSEVEPPALRTDFRPLDSVTGSAVPPFLVQLLRDEPGVRFLAAQFLHLSAPLLSSWVDDRAMARWADWLEDDRRDAPRPPATDQPR